MSTERREPLWAAVLLLAALVGFGAAALVTLAQGDIGAAVVLAIMALVVVEAGR